MNRISCCAVSIATGCEWSCWLHTLMPAEGRGYGFDSPEVGCAVFECDWLVVGAGISHTLIVGCDALLEILASPWLVFVIV